MVDPVLKDDVHVVLGRRPQQVAQLQASEACRELADRPVVPKLTMQMHKSRTVHELLHEPADVSHAPTACCARCMDARHVLCKCSATARTIMAAAGLLLTITLARTWRHADLEVHEGGVHGAPVARELVHAGVRLRALRLLP